MYGKSYKTITREATIEETVLFAYADIGELADEMGEWRDNLEEKFSNTQKYSDVEEVASALEEYREEPSALDEARQYFDGITVEYDIGVKKDGRSVPSRGARLGNAVSMLSSVADYLEMRIDNTDPEKPARGETAEGLRDEIAALEGLRDSLQDTIDNIEGVNFPGMFG